MNIEKTRFCINRKIAPGLSIEAFFRLVKRLEFNKVELRNDMPSGSVTDDLNYNQVRNLAEKYGLEIVTINAVYPFNQLTEEGGGSKKNGRIITRRTGSRRAGISSLSAE